MILRDFYGDGEERLNSCLEDNMQNSFRQSAFCLLYMRNKWKSYSGYK